MSQVATIRPAVIAMIGLSEIGKSTVARDVARALNRRGRGSIVMPFESELRRGSSKAQMAYGKGIARPRMDDADVSNAERADERSGRTDCCCYISDPVRQNQARRLLNSTLRSSRSYRCAMRMSC